MKKYILLFLLGITQLAVAQKSVLTGKIEDAAGGEPLIGATILVNEIPQTGTTSDLDGNFKLTLPVGGYSLKVSSIGYAPVVKTDVILRSGKETNVVIKLAATNIELGEVTVTSDYFDKAVQINNLATVTLAAEEIRRSPGSTQDFQRILQGMAGVSFSNDQNNELLVRGGSPNENLTVFDNMELHSTNHYPNEFNSGGPINMVNVDLIESIQFSTGGFISKYGDKLSSTMVIDTRDGTRNHSLQSNLNLSMAGAGAILEGKINDGKGSWLISARKSYIDLIASSFGLTAIPKYYDFQTKVVYDLSDKHKLSWSSIYGNDKILFTGEPESESQTFAGSKDSVGYQRVDVKQLQWASGITLRSIWTKNMFSLLTVYGNNYHNEVAVSENFTERWYDSKGKLSFSNILKQRPVYNNKSDNYQVAIKSEIVWKSSPSNEVSIGGSLLTANFLQDLYVYGDSSRYFINGVWSPTIIVPEAKLKYDIQLFDNYKSYAFVNDKVKLFDDRMILNVGLRFDYFSYSGKGNVSPRISASYYLIPELTNINFAYGDYNQTQNYPTYGDRYQSDVNKYLDNTHARHYVAGIEHVLDDGLRLSVEGYYKQYEKIPVAENFIHYFDRTFRSERNFTSGKEKVYGIDMMLQQKLVKDIYGTVSYSRMWSKMDDPRIGMEGKTYPSEFDFPHVFTLIVGKRFADLRKEIDELPFFIKYPSYVLPFSDDMEISVRWRFASGKPYTEKVWTTDEQFYEGQMRWSKGNWKPVDEINATRYPDYHRLDVSFNSRYNFSNWNLNVFLSVSNLYNRKNIAGYQYNSDGTKDNIYQFSLFPVGGVEVNF